MELKDRVALVTGASSGIGLATAKLLHKSGMRVVLVARTAAKLEEVAAELGEGAVAIPCDVGELSKLTWLIDQVVARFGGLDVLVNNAGACYHAPSWEVTDEQWSTVFDLNVRALFKASLAAGAVMRESGGGSVRCRATTSCTVAPPNGGPPVSIS